MPVIHFLMEFRLQPLAGAGEDWVSLVIPYNSAASTQSYLLRGLTPGTPAFFTFQKHSTFKSWPFLPKTNRIALVSGLNLDFS